MLFAILLWKSQGKVRDFFCLDYVNTVCFHGVQKTVLQWLRSEWYYRGVHWLNCYDRFTPSMFHCLTCITHYRV